MFFLVGRKLGIITHMPKQSAGILLYRKGASGYEVLLVHPGGPFWAKKDNGSWSIPKGEADGTESMIAAAKREFKEEVGTAAPKGEYTALDPAKQPSGKVVHIFVLGGDLDISQFKSETFEMEWPPKSGAKQMFPENDKAAWVPLAQASQKLVKGQVPIVTQLAGLLDVSVADSIIELPNSQVSLF